MSRLKLAARVFAILGIILGSLIFGLGIPVFKPESVMAQRGSGAQINTDRSENVQIVLSVDDQISLSPVNDEFTVLPGVELNVLLQIPSEGQVQSVVLAVDGTEYPLQKTEKIGEYKTKIVVPKDNSTVEVRMRSAQGERVKIYRLRVVRPGAAYVLGNKLTNIPVDQVLFTVYQGADDSQTLWQPVGKQSNPFLSSDGTFAWYVPNGNYTLEASRENYQTTRQQIVVTDNLLRYDLGLSPNEATATEIRSTYGRFTDREDVQAAAEVVGSASTALALGSTAILVIGFNLLGYLQYLYSLPALLLTRGRRKAYGVVYNSLSKVPIELAIVRVYGADDNKLVKTCVTGKDGRFSLILKPGKYRLVGQKQGFNFPSEYLQGTKDDGQYLDVYTGAIIEIADDDQVITPNIPLDPLEQATDAQIRRAVRGKIYRTLQKVLTPSGLLLSVGAFVIQPTLLAGIFVILQLLVLILVLRLVRSHYIRGRGLVTDTDTKRPLRQAVIRVFETKYNKLIDTVLTDNSGHYAILLGPNVYSVSFSKPGYIETIVKPLDYSQNTSVTPFAAEIGLQRE
jgi:hypothetical protein